MTSTSHTIPSFKNISKSGEHGSLGALRAWVFGFLLIEISSRVVKALVISGSAAWYGMR